MIVQGSNNPLTIQFDQPIDDIPVLVVTLWSDKTSRRAPIKMWTKDTMIISSDTAVCQISESETASFPDGLIVLEAKGLNGDNETVFWDSVNIDIKQRRDKVVKMTEV